eukprot:1392253-Rhodomonas_salina.6
MHQHILRAVSVRGAFAFAASDRCRQGVWRSVLVLTKRMAEMFGSDTRMERSANGILSQTQVRPALSAYAMPGTDAANGAICLRVCYAMPGTDTTYGAVARMDGA